MKTMVEETANNKKILSDERFDELMRTKAKAEKIIISESLQKRIDDILKKLV